MIGCRRIITDDVKGHHPSLSLRAKIGQGFIGRNRFDNRNGKENHMFIYVILKMNPSPPPNNNTLKVKL